MQPVDSEEIAQDLRKGTYFEQARQWYGMIYHAPMAERSFFIVVTLTALLTTFFGIMGFMGLFPLQPAKPFYIPTQEATLVPTIVPLAEETEDPNVALQHFLLSRYVTAREEYDPRTKASYARFVRRQSAPDVTAAYDRQTSQSNPYSPSALYEDRLVRHIRITSLTIPPVPGENRKARIEFEATVGNRDQSETTRWYADVAFRYTGISIDQRTEEITPMTFVVTGYEVHKQPVGKE